MKSEKVHGMMEQVVTGVEQLTAPATNAVSESIYQAAADAADIGQAA
jgi:hypothetical protein